MAASSLGPTTTSTFFLSPPPSSKHPPFIITRKTMLCFASSSSKPRKTIRKNYLRPKILKTLTTKPLPNPIFTESPSPEIPIDQLPPDEFNDELKQFQEAQEEACVEEVNGGLLGKFPKVSIFRIGLFLVGAFVFQTVCAVWVFGSLDSGHKDGILDTTQEDDETRVLRLGFNGISNVKYSVDLEEKIGEIQAMAREVRRKERLEAQANSNNGLGHDDVVKDGIDREVDYRLIQLTKSLRNSYGKTRVGYGDKGGKIVKEGNEALMFKKKYKFKIASMSSSDDKPRGFQGSDKMDNGSVVLEGGVLDETSSGDDGVLEIDQQVDLGKGDENDGREAQAGNTAFAETANKKSGNRKERVKLGKAELLNGISQNGSYRMSRGEALKLGEANNTDDSSSPRLANDQGTSTFVKKGNLLRRGGSLTGRKDGNEELNKGVAQTDSWWLTLPYVLAVFMHTGPDEKGPRGAYTIKNKSHTKDGSSRIVAFEDRGDATNFCYILETAFEEMEDFTADVVPVPTKDLVKAVKSDDMRVLVVKKGQLVLYAGQQLSDVEEALRSMI